jgi:hypothetical protein
VEKNPGLIPNLLENDDLPAWRAYYRETQASTHAEGASFLYRFLRSPGFPLHPNEDVQKALIDDILDLILKSAEGNCRTSFD